MEKNVTTIQILEILAEKIGGDYEVYTTFVRLSKNSSRLEITIDDLDKIPEEYFLILLDLLRSDNKYVMIAKVAKLLK